MDANSQNAGSPVAVAAGRLIAEYEKVLAPLNSMIGVVRRVGQMEFPEPIRSQTARELESIADKCRVEFRAIVADLESGAAKFADFEQSMRSAAGAE